MNQSWREQAPTAPVTRKKRVVDFPNTARKTLHLFEPLEVRYEIGSIPGTHMVLEEAENFLESDNGINSEISD